MSKFQRNSMVFNILIKKEESLFVAHCLELDIVTSSNDIDDVKKDIVDLIKAQINYAFSNDNIDNLFKPAPKEVWKEFWDCKNVQEKDYQIAPPKNIKSILPPGLTTITCISEPTHCYV